METFAEVLRSRSGDTKVGLRYEDTQWTWDEVVRECADRAAALTAEFPPPSGRQLHIGVLLRNIPDYVFWLGAAALTGSVVVGINSSRRGSELAHDIRHADCDVIITASGQEWLLADVDHGVPAERVFDVDSGNYTEFLRPFRGVDLPQVLPDPELIYLLLFSSGSTGAPKAVIVSQGRLARLTDALAERVEMRRESVAYCCMPLFHGNAVMMNLAPAMSMGATVAMRRAFSASGFSADIHRYGVTYVNYVGRALSYVLTTPEDSRDPDSTLELAYGTEASAADMECFAARFGCRVVEGYGSSEGVFRIGRTPDTPASALGKPANGTDVRVLDEDTGKECPPAHVDQGGRLLDADAVGQMVAIGKAQAFEGYYKNPEAMADRVRGEDFWSGDLAYRDQDGFFYFAGRSSDWLRVDSENIAAAPIERVLQHFPGVASAQVYAVPDARTGDTVMCALEMADGATFDPEEFARFLEGQPDMGTKWLPAFVRIVAAIPLTGSNKVNKAPLRRTAWNTADPVWVRGDRSTRYARLDAEGRDAIERELVAHGRAALLPAPLAEEGAR